MGLMGQVGLRGLVGRTVGQQVAQQVGQQVGSLGRMETAPLPTTLSSSCAD